MSRHPVATRSSRPLLAAALALLTAALLASCGGGGGGGGGDPVACAPIIDSAGNSLACDDPFWGGGGGGSDGDSAGADGTAGDGAAIVGATVRLVDATGRTASATTDAQGYYRVNITRFTPPFVLTLTTADGEQRHHSFSTQAPRKRAFITINITGLTDKLASDVAVAAGQSGARQLTPAMVAANPNAVTTALNQLRQTLRNPIVAAGLPPDTFDPITLFFRPNLQGHDLVLETVAVYLDSTGATQVVPKPQTACTTPRRWSAGANQCAPTTTPGYIANGQTLRLSDDTGALVGQADFACINGNLSTVGTPTCVESTQQPCSAPAAGWNVGSNACTADTAPTGLAHGASLTLTDSASPITGSITYACSNGTLSTTGTPSCAAANQPCSAPSASWTVGTSACTADNAPGSVAHGATLTLTDSASPTTGNITYACSNGALSTSGTPSCSTVAAGSPCAAPAASWSAGGQTCQADVAPTTMNSGTQQTLQDAIGTATGSIAYACSDGTLGIVGSPQCGLTPGTCAAPPATWSVGSAQCAADTPPEPVLNGHFAEPKDTQGRDTGSILWRCSSGQLLVIGDPVCRTTEPQACAAPSPGWVVGSNSCSSDATPTGIASGASLSLTDTSAPAIGGITYSCSNGTLTVSGTPTCNAATAAPCDSSKLAGSAWTVGNNQCQPDSVPASTASGTTIVLTDDTGDTKGKLSLQCVDGGLFTVGDPTCEGLPPPKSCTASVKVWGSEPYTCSPTKDPGTVDIPHGSTFTWVDSTAVFTGSHTLACSNGTLSEVSSVCNYDSGTAGARRGSLKSSPAKSAASQR